MDIQKGDIVKLKGNTLYKVNNIYKNLITIRGLIRGNVKVVDAEKVNLVERLEDLINTRVNAVNLTSNRRSLVGQVDTYAKNFEGFEVDNNGNLKIKQ